MGITIGGGKGRGREVNLGDRLPIQHEEGAQVVGGLAALIFGGIFAVTPDPLRSWLGRMRRNRCRFPRTRSLGCSVDRPRHYGVGCRLLQA